MEVPSLPDLHQYLSKQVLEGGGFSTNDLQAWILVLLIWLNLQYKHEELHTIVHELVEKSKDNFLVLMGQEELRADSWRPRVDAGDLDALPKGLHLTDAALKMIADRVEVTVPDFVPEGF